MTDDTKALPNVVLRLAAEVRVDALQSATPRAREAKHLQNRKR
jgi:hypothetical protein